MLGDLTGPGLLALIAVALVAIGAIIALIIVFAVKSSNKTRQAELQRAYEAGQQANQQR